MSSFEKKVKNFAALEEILEKYPSKKFDIVDKLVTIAKESGLNTSRYVSDLMLDFEIPILNTMSLVSSNTYDNKKSIIELGEVLKEYKDQEIAFDIFSALNEVVIGEEIDNFTKFLKEYHNTEMVKSFLTVFTRYDEERYRPDTESIFRKLLSEEVIQESKQFKFKIFFTTIVETAYTLDSSFVEGIAKVYNSEQVKKTLNAFEDSQAPAIALATIGISNPSSKTILKCAQVFEKYCRIDRYAHVAPILTTIVTSTDKFADIFLKYFDNHPDEIIKSISSKYANGGLNSDSTNELLTDQAYEAILKDSSLIEKILSGRSYSNIRNDIEDKEFRKTMSYNELDIIAETYNFVSLIHKYKNTNQKADIKKGFYSQLNRAISQGHDNKSKLEMLKQYCQEVQDQVKENVQDLMAVHND